MSEEARGTDVHMEKGLAAEQVNRPENADSFSDKRGGGPQIQSTDDAPRNLQSSSLKGDAQENSSSYLLMPSSRLAQEPAIRNGCWARIYGERDFEGGALTLTGPLSMPTMLGPFGISWKNRVRSIELGTTAVMTVFDNVDFKQKIATIGPGKRIADLSKKTGYFDDFSSMKIFRKI